MGAGEFAARPASARRTLEQNPEDLRYLRFSRGAGSWYACAARQPLVVRHHGETEQTEDFMGRAKFTARPASARRTLEQNPEDLRYLGFSVVPALGTRAQRDSRWSFVTTEKQSKRRTSWGGQNSRLVPPARDAHSNKTLKISVTSVSLWCRLLVRVRSATAAGRSSPRRNRGNGDLRTRTSRGPGRGSAPVSASRSRTSP